MQDFIRTASIRQLSKIWITTTEVIYYWGMNSLENVFKTIDTYISEIFDFVDVGKIKERLFKICEARLKVKQNSDKPQIHDLIPLGFEPEPRKDIPELITVRDRFKEAFILVPSGIEKAEAWLYPYACGNNTASFLRDTMAPLITPETRTYKVLRKDIFGI